MRERELIPSNQERVVDFGISLFDFVELNGECVKLCLSM